VPAYQRKCKLIKLLIGILVNWLPCVQKWHKLPQEAQDVTEPEDWDFVQAWEQIFINWANRLSYWASEQGYYLD